MKNDIKNSPILEDIASLGNLPEKSEVESSSSAKRQECYLPKRYVIILLLFLGMILIHAQRVNLGVTIVRLVDNSPSNKTDSNRNSSADTSTHLHWSPNMIGWLHAAFPIGMFVGCVPGGYVAVRYPAHRLFGWCCLVSNFLNVLMPVSMVRLGYVITFVLRLLQGATESVCYPTCYVVIRRWSVVEERSRVGSTVLTGWYVGPTIGMIFSSMLVYYAGWQYAFYAYGGAGLLWYVFWFIFVYEKPSLHPTITEAEKRRMEKDKEEILVQNENIPVPWKSILTSLPVYSLIACSFSRTFSFYMLYTYQSTYLNIFNFPVIENGLYSCLPFAFLAITCIASGRLSDYLWTKPWISITTIRKILTCTGFGIQALFMFGLGLTKVASAAIVFLILGTGASGIANAGFQINQLDLAPRFQSIIVSITMSAGITAGIINPIAVAAITQDQTLQSWQRVFWMVGTVAATTSLVYGFFGSAKRQPWADPVEETDAENVQKSHYPVSNSSSEPYGTFQTQSQVAPLSDHLPPHKAMTEHSE